MRNLTLYLLLAALTGLSACIKVENELIKCSSAPPAPVPLDNTVPTKTIGSLVEVAFSNYQDVNVYRVTAPDGISHSSQDRYPIEFYINADTAGIVTYKLTAANGMCTSAASDFKVNVIKPLTSCGLSTNTCVTNTGGYTTTLESGSNYGSYYGVEWWLSGSYSRTISLFFDVKPPSSGTTTYTVSNVDRYNLTGNQCRVEHYYYGDDYVGLGGSVDVTYVNGNYRLNFCDVRLNTIPASSTAITAKGVLTFRN